MELLALPPFAAGPDVPQQIMLEMLEETLANVSALMSWVFFWSGTVLQTALCYLEAIHPEVPNLIREERMGIRDGIVLSA